ncbi:MAG: hypothetical protein KGJ86_20690, partial [Chloroflexota bacterium]|nr:hypothetical protein [Chloroflexota bacterium]
MKLVQQVHQVHEVAWAGDTRLQAGRLSIDRAALTTDLLDDTRLESVDLELAHPGESCRILPVFDVVEPRAKLDPDGADFPGALTPVQPVGFGLTRVLRGVAVTVVDPGPSVPGRTPMIDLRSAPLDGHSAAELSRYAGLHHVVVIPHFAQGVEGDDRRHALRLASLRAAVRIAKTAQVEQPDEERTFELTPAGEDLPRVAYVFQLHSHQI